MAVLEHMELAVYLYYCIALYFCCTWKKYFNTVTVLSVHVRFVLYKVSMVSNTMIEKTHV